MISEIRHNLRNNYINRVVLRTIISSLIIIALFTLITFFLLNISLDFTIKDEMNSSGNTAVSITNTFINEKSSELSSLSEIECVKAFLSDTVLTKEKDIQKSVYYNQLINTLRLIKNYDSSILNAWVASESAKFCVTDEYFIPAGEYSIDSQAWRSKFIGNTSNWVSAVNENSYTGEQYISFVTAVFDNQNIVGYCGIDVNVTSLKNLINSYNFSDGSYMLIINDYGDIIYSPDNSEFINTFDVESYPFKSFIQAPASTTGLEEFVVEDNIYYVFTSATNARNWYTVMAFDSQIISGWYLNSLLQQYAVFICMFLLLILIIVNIIRTQSHEIKNIRNAVTQVNNDNFSFRINSEEEGEIADISRVIDKMSAEIEKSRSEISNHRILDSLTQIPNRISMYRSLDDMLECRDDNCNRFAMLFVDLDNFKWMNETLGHKFGDECLIKFAQETSDTLKGIGKVFRFSGDEFVILTECDDNLDKVNEIINKMNSAFDSPIVIGEDKIYLRFSIGVAVFPDDDTTADLLLRDADIALHRAKKSGKDRVAFYNNVQDDDSISSAAIANQLNTALSNSELTLNYQPIINLENNDIHGFEVLVRWQSSQFGLIPPSDFIQVAEEAGTIVQIGTWVFETACRFLKGLCEKYNRDDFIMSINVSPVQLKRDDYLEHVKRILEITQLNPKNIQIEITEGTLLEYTGNEENVLDKIHQMGIVLAIDDFGTGYASMNYLKSYPFSCLKVDKSFIDEIYNNEKDYTITDTIIDLVHNLGISTIAEGVETVAQYNFLRKMKCDYVQGFLVSKPLDEAATYEFIEKYDTLKSDESILRENEKILEKERKEKEKLKQEYKSNQVSKSSINQPDTVLTHNSN